MLDPILDYRLYREEMDRVERELERRRQLPARERRRLSPVRFSFPRLRAGRRMVSPGGC